MKKKGDAYRILWNSIARLPFIALLLIIFSYIAANFSATAIDAYRSNDQILIKRVLYSPTALAYQDPETLRVYPGIIDLSKATQENIDSAFVLNVSYIAAKVEIKTIVGTTLHELYINKVWYDRWNPYSSYEQYDKEVFKQYVLLRNGDALNRGLVRIHVISPNG